MPRIYDNMEHRLLEALQETLKISQRADFCVGYFNLRGWQHLDRLMENWQGGEQGRCRLMIGMQETPVNEVRKLFSLRGTQNVDQSTVSCASRIASRRIFANNCWWARRAMPTMRDCAA